MKNTSIVNILIENINVDQGLLEKIDETIEKAKEEKREIARRLKDYRKDISTFLKYADEDQRQKITELGFDFSESENGLNAVAKLAYDLMVKVKDNQMTNEELYNAYVNTFKNKGDAYDYTQFNIKCRSLFNTQRLLRKKGKDPKSSRDDIISINGRVEKATEPSTDSK
ncbi:MAG: hypothetical protein ACSHW7_02210 [Patiriisocius sp.]|uniref:hypothetical protein n=1 Tax=Patiriisocius sp. TaxID=2822396 RepID=UPI003EF791C0